MGDLDDMNATPLGKLPLPAMQMKADAPRVESMSYGDILKDMNKAADPVPRGPGGPSVGGFLPGGASRQVQQQFQPPIQPAQFSGLQGAGLQAAGLQGAQIQQAPPQPVMYDEDDGMPLPQPRRRRVRFEDDDDEYIPRKRKHGSGMMARLKMYRSSIVVAGVVFLVLTYVSPRLAQMIPRLLTPTGRFNMIGLFIIAAMCGGIHRVADEHVVSRWM